MRLTARHVLGTAVVGIVAWPALHLHPRDDFPLSTYPMFTARRGRIASVNVVVGRDRTGKVVRLDPTLIADTDEVMLAAETVTASIIEGHADDLCGDVAERIDPSKIDVVEVRTEQYDTVDWLHGDREPRQFEVRARCEVPS